MEQKPKQLSQAQSTAVAVGIAFILVVLLGGLLTIEWFDISRETFHFYPTEAEDGTSGWQFNREGDKIRYCKTRNLDDPDNAEVVCYPARFVETPPN